jgi:hypothetical protein
MANKLSEIVNQVAEAHSFSPAAVQALAEGLLRGDFRRAKFNHPELGGIGLYGRNQVIIGNMEDEALRGRILNVIEALVPRLEPDPAYPPAMEHDVTLVMPWWGDLSLGSPDISGVFENNIQYGYFLESHRVITRKGDVITHHDARGLSVSNVGIKHGERGEPYITLYTLNKGEIPVSKLDVIAEDRDDDDDDDFIF